MKVELRITFDFNPLPDDNPSDPYKFIHKRIRVAIVDTMRLIGCKNIKIEILS